ncbi:MAG: glycosyl transferase family 2, partial [Variovorax sp.]|nr:glycosyl transferase family 2 [Variovorax sp.]
MNSADDSRIVEKMNSSSVLDQSADFFDALASEQLDPLFWTPHLIGKPSAWWAHVPFAFWLMTALRPRVFVELGTHYGVSYAAFCEAAARVKIPARCYAVDTWAGDAHAGKLDEQVYNELRDFHDKHYSAFSEMLRCQFDEALNFFEDGSVDLLHIDGYHTYDAVRHDFESWYPKLSSRAVVVFHDTNVRRDDFGVYRFFGEISKKYPSFEFLHGFGLGIVAVGDEVPLAVRQLCDMQSPIHVNAIRERFSHLGARWFVTTHERLATEQVYREVNKVTEEKNQLAQGLQQAATQAEARFAQALADAENRAAGAVVKGDERAAEIRAETEARIAQTMADTDARIAQTMAETQAQIAVAAEREKAEQERASKAEAARIAAERNTTRARAAMDSTKRLREQAANRTKELRKIVEQLTGQAEYARSGLVELQNKFDVLSRRYAAAFDEVPTSFAAQLKIRLNRVSQRFRKRSPGGGANVIDTVRRSIYFDREWYLATYPDVAARGMDAAVHYVNFGAREGRAPGPWFSGEGYLQHNPDVAQAGINPLYHYMVHGQLEGRTDGSKPGLSKSLGAAVVSQAPKKSLSLLYVSAEPDTPGNRYRVKHYVEAARQNGAEAAWIRIDQLAEQLDNLARYDVLVIWRAPWSESVEAAIRQMHSQRKKVVFDVDDLMIDASLAEVHIIDGIRSQFLAVDSVRSHYELVRRTMLAADACFTTTEELAFHMRWVGKSTHVLPNGFDQHTHDLSRRCAREWRADRTDGLIRMGYAGGSRTHQRDLGLAIDAIARVLREHEQCRLVLFRAADGTPLIDIEEYACLAGLEEKIEWRLLQPIEDLPRELVRFDINLAPLEAGNIFCEAKSELKYFEGALAHVPTVASPTGPYKRSIDHGRTGFLAISADEWYSCLKQLCENAESRDRVAQNAYHDALARFGPLQRATRFGTVLDQLRDGPIAARGFALDAYLTALPATPPRINPFDVVFEKSAKGWADVTVVIPLYNYERYIVEALESVGAQTLDPIELVIVDDCSTDGSLEAATAWSRENSDRFNRISVIKNRINQGLAFSRNNGFAYAETPYVLPLDADNRLLPACCEQLLQAIC